MSQINVNTIKDKSGLGAPSFPNGVNATGVITATSFSGDGGNLTGIDASSLRVGGATKVQATSTGLVITGIATASNFKTGSTNVHSVGVEAAGINVLGGDTPIGAGSTIYDNGNASFNGNVTSDGNITAAGNVTAAGNINANGNIVGDNSTNITGINAITASGNISAVDATFTGNVSVGATLTYEDVTNIDSVGLVTARGGVRVTSGGMVVAGISTFSGALDINAGVNISGLGDFAASTFNNIRAAWSGDGEIDTSSGNLTLDSAGGTVVVDDNLTVNGASTLGSPSANNTTFINSTTAAHSNANTLVVGHGSGNYAGMTFQCAAAYPGGIYFTDTDNGQQGGIAYYHNGDQLRFIAGETQYMSIDSSAITANNSVPFVGNLTGNVTGNTSGSSGSCTGNALTATTLQNARTIAGVSFNGSANISLNNNAITNGAGYITSSGISGGFSAGNASNLNSGTVPSARLGSSGTRSSSTYLRGDNTWVDDGCFIRADAADTASGDITFSGGAGAITIAANSDIQLASGSWTGETTKIQHHSNWLYFVGGSNGIYFRSQSGANRWRMDSSGHFEPDSDNSLNIGDTSNRVANVYATTFHGSGANLTSIPAPSSFSSAVDFSDELHLNGSEKGLSHSTHTAMKFYVNSSQFWGVEGSGNCGFRFKDSSSTRGYLMATANDEVGFLSEGGNWSLKTTNAGATVSGTLTASGAITTSSGGISCSGGNIAATASNATVSDGKGNLRSIPRNNQGSAYTLVSADAGKCITAAGNITVNNSVFSEGDAVTIIADTGSDITITQGSGVTMYNAGDASTGNKTLAARGMCTIWFVAANNCYISGAGLS